MDIIGHDFRWDPDLLCRMHDTSYQAGEQDRHEGEWTTRHPMREVVAVLLAQRPSVLRTGLLVLRHYNEQFFSLGTVLGMVTTSG